MMMMMSVFLELLLLAQGLGVNIILCRLQSKEWRNATGGIYKAYALESIWPNAMQNVLLLVSELKLLSGRV
jgi:hypothetical protein